MAPSLIVAAAAIFRIILSSSAGVDAHGGRISRRLVRSDDVNSPCKQMRLYFHDILYDYSNDTTNSTSAAVTKPTALSTADAVVFDDPVTDENSLPPPSPDHETAVRAQGLYFYDGKEAYKAWLAFSLVFNSTAHGRGTLELMGADPWWVARATSSCRAASPRSALK
uniref:Dirigent protein n=1 Tax=Leersia perrieri TaxID=77586 RepID=A0A0D9X253_9ORYZ